MLLSPNKVRPSTILFVNHITLFYKEIVTIHLKSQFHITVALIYQLSFIGTVKLITQRITKLQWSASVHTILVFVYNIHYILVFPILDGKQIVCMYFINFIVNLNRDITCLTIFLEGTDHTLAKQQSDSKTKILWMLTFLIDNIDVLFIT